jgi:hypothetical protein
MKLIVSTFMIHDHIHSRTPAVDRVQVHLSLHQNVVFSGDQPLPSVQYIFIFFFAHLFVHASTVEFSTVKSR